MAVRAVLFDFDGVLADTENIQVAAWQRTLSALGWSIPDEVAARAAEVDDRAFLNDLFWARGVTEGDVEGWLQRKGKLTLEMLRDSPRIYPGVLSLVSALQGRVALAVVTGTFRENVRTVLEAVGLASAFPVIVSKEDVHHLKPAPDAYAFAVQKLGVEPSEAVALEDSPTGLSSAQRVGIRTIAVGHRRPSGPWNSGVPYLESLVNTSEVLALLGLGETTAD